MLGCANQSGEDNRNVARMALLLSGIPHTVPGVTVNRLCASGMEAVASVNPITYVLEAGRSLLAGDPEEVLLAFGLATALAVAFVLWALGGLRRAEAAG